MLLGPAAVERVMSATTEDTTRPLWLALGDGMTAAEAGEGAARHTRLIGRLARCRGRLPSAEVQTGHVDVPAGKSRPSLDRPRSLSSGM